MIPSRSILIFSYYLSPHQGVGSVRASYWAEELHQYGYVVTVITTSSNKSDYESPFYKRIVVQSPLSKNSGEFIFNMVKDPGFKWSKSIKSFFQQNKGFLDQFDVCLLSGGPFGQFSLSKYIIKNSTAKIVLDYRDPFAVNPRFKDGLFKKLIKTKLEKSFNKYADLIITVNSFCKDLICEEDVSKIKIIENGFDERQLENSERVKNKEVKNNKLLYAGTIFKDRNPDKLLKILASSFTQMKFYHAGKLNEIAEELKMFSNYQYLGFLTYQDTLKEINESEICLIITSGEPFESTTKVYDYISRNSKILIITQRIKNTGSLEEVTKDYPAVCWAEYNSNSVTSAINELISTSYPQIDIEKYSRKSGIARLANLLDEL